jgi:sulfatase modifying factor 1
VKRVALVAALVGVACTPSKRSAPVGDGGANGEIVSVPSAIAPGVARPGMVFIPAGNLHAGTPADETPRVPEEELPGVDVAMSGFYMDVLPYPNEAVAIQVTNVSRDEAAKLCAAKSKRLCTELEWERACKGPANTRYEYGDDYRADVCTTGVSAEQSAMHPSGQRPTCVSGFGVRDMHGGAWEWTDSTWGRGVARDLGVLRGGNARAGEIVGRCANALGRSPDTRSGTMGFRCCAGPKNDAIVDLEVKFGPPISILDSATKLPQAVLDLPCPSPLAGDGACVYEHGWIWRPMGNVVIYLRNGCKGSGLGLRCGIVAATLVGDAASVMGHANVGREIPDVVLLSGEGKSIRARGGDVHGPVFKEFVYAYGKVEVRGRDPDL